MSTLKGSVEAVRRKLRVLNTVIGDASTTENEKANAEVLRARLEQQLRAAGEPAGDWTDKLFRLGRQVKELRKATYPGSPKRDWTVGAFRLSPHFSQRAGLAGVNQGGAR
jgi:hypothetical protein